MGSTIQTNGPEQNDALISVYTCVDAVEDGILTQVERINPAWSVGIISHITIGVLDLGYWKKDGHDEKYLSLPNCFDLLLQAQEIIRKGSTVGKAAWLYELEAMKNTTQNWFYSGEVEFPDGKTREVYIELNETERYTVLLPEEH